ncbi:hypothetical protein L210DRAFT_934214 [Boletus edulis BED1]|uniref:Uncharacterized protein n=1 Tax=Boletus edulis BED1 TaxID=1328754 RepID=A0AAD4G992_BOLED|nr:hypothetical protein L210DRAFT_934214 [Boletus edulis BED1]
MAFTRLTSPRVNGSPAILVIVPKETNAKARRDIYPDVVVTSGRSGVKRMRVEDVFEDEGAVMKITSNLFAFFLWDLDMLKCSEKDFKSDDVFMLFGRSKGNRREGKVPYETEIFDCVSEGLSLFLVPGHAKRSDEIFHVGEIVIITIDLTIADVEELSVRSWESKNGDIIDPFLGGTHAKGFPDFESGSGDLILETSR